MKSTFTFSRGYFNSDQDHVAPEEVLTPTQLQHSLKARYCASCSAWLVTSILPIIHPTLPLKSQAILAHVDQFIQLVVRNQNDHENNVLCFQFIPITTLALLAFYSTIDACLAEMSRDSGIHVV